MAIPTSTHAAYDRVRQIYIDFYNITKVKLDLKASPNTTPWQTEQVGRDYDRISASLTEANRDLSVLLAVDAMCVI